LDIEIDVVDGVRAVRVDLADPLERDLSHPYPLLPAGPLFEA
jgi:hypothetical protein